MGAWYDDAWNWIKGATRDVGEVVKNVAPLLPLVLKKGGSVSEFKDTPENRKKLVKLFNELHHSKVPISHLNKMKSGGMVEAVKDKAYDAKELLAKRGRGRPRKK